mmetsp:Transcript_12460/g.43251  ORF Transcript_12460/g.43251 Transcript_12460/m.43251 type:complete len:217 (+) Transcript_12460:1355-2005(+)
MPLVGCASTWRGTPPGSASWALGYVAASRGTASATLRVGSTSTSSSLSCAALSAAASATMAADSSAVSAASRCDTRSFSSASSFASYPASALATTVTLCVLSRKRRRIRLCQKPGSASRASTSLAAFSFTRSGLRASPPCSHVPMTPMPTPRPKLGETRAAPSSIWCTTASTRSRGNPSSATRSSVSSTRASTLAASSALTPFRPTAKDVSLRPEP